MKVVVLFLAAVLALFMLRDMIGGLTALVTTPVYQVKEWFLQSSATVPSYFRDREILIDRIEELEREVSLLTGRSAVPDMLENENKRLRSLLQMEGGERIGAGVIARPPHVPYDALLIDRGSTDGVAEGAVVYHGEHLAIGFVSRAFAKSALISLFSSPGIESTVYIIGADIYTTAYGEGGGVLRVSVPQGITLNTGDIVVLPSIASGLLGEINAVESVPTKPEQNGFVTFASSTQSLQFVSVGTHVPETVSFEAAQTLIRDARARFLEVDVPDEVIVETSTSTAATSTNDNTIESDVNSNTEE